MSERVSAADYQALVTGRGPRRARRLVRTLAPQVIACTATLIEFTVPIRIEPEMNTRDGWRARAARFAQHREAIRACWPRVAGAKARIGLPATATLTRIAPRRIDDGDNLESGFKAARDQVAANLGADDKDGSGITWEYAQAKGRAKEYGVRIHIRTADQTKDER